MAGRNRKKKQGCVEEPRFLNRSKEDPWVLVRRLEARLAQEKFYHEKTKTESQYEIKTLQAKVKSLERQKKTYLEKLEQNPIEQQAKLEKELNETSKQLRETTQKLAGSQQIIDRLTRTNRGLKKAKERTEEHYTKEIEKKNKMIQKLEEQILEAQKENNSLGRLVGEILAPPTAKIADSFEDRECWELPELEIWEKFSVHKDRAEREEKGQKKGDKEMTASKTLEEKTQIAEDCKLSFFPSMYEGNGKERCKGKPSPDKAVQNLPTTSKDNCNSVSIDEEQQNGSKHNTNNRPNQEDGTPIQETRASPSEALPDLAKQESKLSVSNRRFKCWNKAKMDNMARYGALKGSCYPQTDDCINRLKNVCSRITVGSKTEAAQNPPDANNGNREVYKAVPRSPPPGFETTGTGFAVHAGIDASKSSCVESAGN